MEEENLEVGFEEIMDQDSDEESVLSNDTDFASDASEYETDLEEKFIPAAEIRALNDRTKYCMIQSYYTTGGPLTVCAACMVLLADIDTVGMHYIKKHNINYIDALSGRFCTNCRIALYTIFPCNMAVQDTRKDVIRVLGKSMTERDTSVRISPVQFLRDRELGICGQRVMEQAKICNQPVYSWPLFARQKVYTRLFNKYCENYDFENRYKTRRLTDNNFFCVENRDGDCLSLLQEYYDSRGW
ncbi:hypothetical protein ALC57_00374 [Trachymyrmex cornetzi]|uniref:Uncharacterized protein n=1 Tax=Trachymyrmex cornetzi TaxID=471704 RepID=A0A151JS33_9HYME|nr:hypothetical protein ALC57_00374 [Trachymyrmex cornetzi]